MSIAVVGLSFGAQSCVIAQAKRGGVDVILNESSKRLNPSLVSFVDKERALGEAASTQVSNGPARARQILGGPAPPRRPGAQAHSAWRGRAAREPQQARLRSTTELRMLNDEFYVFCPTAST